MSTSILRPCRPQFYIHVDLNFTSISTAILRPCRPQLYVHVDLNFTSMSTSILRPCRPQLRTKAGTVDNYGTLYLHSSRQLRDPRLFNLPKYLTLYRLWTYSLKFTWAGWVSIQPSLKSRIKIDVRWRMRLPS